MQLTKPPQYRNKTERICAMANIFVQSRIMRNINVLCQALLFLSILLFSSCFDGQIYSQGFIEDDDFELISTSSSKR